MCYNSSKINADRIDSEGETCKAMQGGNMKASYRGLIHDDEGRSYMTLGSHPGHNGSVLDKCHSHTLVNLRTVDTEG